MTAFKEILIGGYVLRFWPSDNGWVCGITESMMDALAQQVVSPQHTWAGLTDAEIAQMGLSNYIKVVRETETKLKEKNYEGQD